MQPVSRIQAPRRIGLALAVVGAGALIVGTVAPVGAFSPFDTYTVNWLVSDQANVATHQDPNLVNAWGIAASPTSPWWVSNNGTGTSTLYNGNGDLFPPASPLVVNVPGAPTGMVWNGTGQFPVAAGNASASSSFIWASEDGTISGWNGAVPMAGNKQAFHIATANDGAIYKGLAIGSSNGANYLYATDFHNGKVDVLNGSNQYVHWAGAFTDPLLQFQRGYAPFGIQTINGTIYVTYAKQDAEREDEAAGVGRGIVDAYSTDGSFLGRVVTGGALNAPWGLAMAPQGFGHIAGDLLVGNFGDGRITAYKQIFGFWAFDGYLFDTGHRPLSIDGLWGIGFGNNANSGPSTTLYFAAGPGGESHGLFGSIVSN